MRRELISLLLLCPAASFSQPAPWGVQRIQPTGIKTTGIEHWAVSPSGDIYLASNRPEAVVRKVSATGQQIFSTPLIGVSDFESMLMGSDGSIYLSGFAGTTFVTTPGAYKAVATPDGGFLCKLNAADGHVVYCTYVDMTFPGLGGLSADPQGN